MNMQQLMKQAQKMQQQLEAAQLELAATEDAPDNEIYGDDRNNGDHEQILRLHTHQAAPSPLQLTRINVAVRARSRSEILRAFHAAVTRVQMKSRTGWRCAGYSLCYATLFQHADATCAEKLAAAGAVLMGKLTTHEFADGGPSFDLPRPPARNPWNTDHFTAGSSSGTGAAVAAGMIFCGIGTDTGGSIRGPAAYCGVAGLKPTYGLVSRAGVAPAAFSLDHIGPMAWTAEDCAIMLQALAGHDPRDPASADRPIPDYRAALGGGIKGLKVGVIHHFHETDHKVGDDTQRGISAAIETFRGLGAEIREVVEIVANVFFVPRSLSQQ